MIFWHPGVNTPYIGYSQRMFVIIPGEGVDSIFTFFIIVVIILILVNLEPAVGPGVNSHLCWFAGFLGCIFYFRPHRDD